MTPEPSDVSGSEEPAPSLETGGGLVHLPLSKGEPHEFHSFVIAIIKRVETADLASFEERNSDLTALRDLVAAMAEVSIEVLNIIFTYYDRLGTQSKTGESEDAATLCRQIDRRVFRLRSAEDIADLAFVAGLGLQSRRVALRNVELTEDRWEVIGVANSTCREILKSMSALETAICQHEGMESQNTYYLTEVERCVRTRAAYHGFRKAIPIDDPSGDDTVRRRLRLCAIAIAKLIGRDIYPSLRVRDREQIRELQERILEWLRDDRQTSARAFAGRRVWQDLSSFAELLQQVNNRAELRKHDQEQIEIAIGRCRALTQNGQKVVLKPICVCAALTRLLGRDPALDQLIEDGDPIDVADLQQLLLSMESRFAPCASVEETIETNLLPLDENEDFI